MDPDRIAELLRPFSTNPCHSEQGRRPSEACPERSRREPAVLSPAQLQSISTYIDLLLHWNARINLTAIRDPEEIVRRHFGESLFAARHLFPKPYPVSSSVTSVSSVVNDLALACNASIESPLQVADLGSGAGFPGIPIKLWAPDIHLTLIESNQKKAAFLREVVRTLTLTNVNIQNIRAEDIPQTFDVVTLRAVERFSHILPVATSLLAPRARLVLLVGSSQVDEARSVASPLSWQEPISIPESKFRFLLIGTLEPRK